MEIITNLEDAKNIAIGKCFIYGEYAGYPIVWQKIDEKLAMSEKVLDCIVFDSSFNGKTNEPILSRWCNEILRNSLGLSQDIIYPLTKKELLKYSSTDESRQAEPTEWAIMHGVFIDYYGKSPYWICSPMSCWFDEVDVVDSSGALGRCNADSSNIGVRPALKLDKK